MKLQADPKHEQDHAELGELVGDHLVGDEPGRIRPDQEAGKQVTDDRREPDAKSQIPADERGCQRGGQRLDELQLGLRSDRPDL
jgi:hypothetical protein